MAHSWHWCLRTTWRRGEARRGSDPRHAMRYTSQQFGIVAGVGWVGE
ncbi:hypothetical protein E2C01_078826 [Portunus trituberculatus]|uniref:Uncharacterized protein n=1 Tax=Portunus trituberculatus TaxID=210409 RepID=A0A5B7IFD8_PORTR|nr:hypothetical protein [Portunus trituberculatus]